MSSIGHDTTETSCSAGHGDGPSGILNTVARFNCQRVPDHSVPVPAQRRAGGLVDSKPALHCDHRHPTVDRRPQTVSRACVIAHARDNAAGCPTGLPHLPGNETPAARQGASRRSASTKVLPPARFAGMPDALTHQGERCQTFLGTGLWGLREHCPCTACDRRTARTIASYRSQTKN